MRELLVCLRTFVSHRAWCCRDSSGLFRWRSLHVASEVRRHPVRCMRPTSRLADAKLSRGWARCNHPPTSLSPSDSVRPHAPSPEYPTARPNHPQDPRRILIVCTQFGCLFVPKLPAFCRVYANLLAPSLSAPSLILVYFR